MQADVADQLFEAAGLPDPDTLTKGQTYGVVKGVRSSLLGCSDLIGQQLLRFKSDLGKIIAAGTVLDQAKNFKRLIELINRATDLGATPEARIQRIVRWTRTFGPMDILDNSQNRAFQDQSDIASLIDEIYDGGFTVSSAFRKYCKDYPGAAANIHAMRKTLGLAGKPKTLVYSVIHFLHHNGLTADNLTGPNVVNVFDMASKAPPYTKFSGVASWGSGNHSDATENKQMHFYKHCLDAHPLDKEKLDWHGECPIWWKTLNIQLTRQDVQDKVASPLRETLLLLFGGADVLPHDKAEEAVKAARQAGGWGAPILTHLHAAHGAAYADHALDMSRAMTNVMVHADTKKAYAVMLKGIHGQFFIGSRIENDVLSISTCFVPRPGTDLAGIRSELKLWDIKQD